MYRESLFGRARLDLLSRRFVLAPRERRTQAAAPQEQPQVHAMAASLRVPAEVRWGLKAEVLARTPTVRGGLTG